WRGGGRKVAGNDAADNVGRAARRERNNDGDRPRRITLRPRGARENHQHGSADDKLQTSSAEKFHGAASANAARERWQSLGKSHGPAGRRLYAICPVLAPGVRHPGLGGDHSPWGSSCSAAAAGTASVLNSVASSDDLVDSIGASVSVSTACAGGSVVSVVSAASAGFATDRLASALVILTALTATMRAPANATTKTAYIGPQLARRRSAIGATPSCFVTSSDRSISTLSRDGSELTSGKKRISNSFAASLAPESRTAERSSL